MPTDPCIARASVQRALAAGIQKGCLIVREADGEVRYGQDPAVASKSVRKAELCVKCDKFWARVYLSYDLGFSEAYMHGDFTTPDLKAILELWLDNRESLSGLRSLFSHMQSLASIAFIRFFGQSLTNARLNVITGYECSNDFFEALLSRDITYSCALWTPDIGGVRGDLEGGSHEGDLEKAQLNKIAHLLEKARLRPGDRLLEFGSGWGSLAIQAGKLGCTVDTITLSTQQKVLAEKRIAEQGLEKKVRVHLVDYRHLPPEFEHAFDGFISVEMVEAVGFKYLPRFFQILDWALKPDRACAVITATTQPESRYTVYQPEDYARRYQWPNSFCPSATSFVSTAASSTRGSLVLESVENFGHHYPRTLREWGARLQNNWTAETIAKVRRSQPHLETTEDLEAFKRKWEYMCVYAEVGYAGAYTSMHYFTFSRPESVVERCD
ncbi:CFS1-like protein [Dichomitus squalens]|nr:CFS1-like protein [Dichomitus squalens]